MSLLNNLQIQEMIQTQLPNAQVMVEDLTGTSDHFKATVISEEFIGKSLLQRHQLINEILKEPLKGPIHALTIDALTPDQWTQKQNTKTQSRFGGIKVT